MCIYIYIVVKIIKKIKVSTIQIGELLRYSSVIFLQIIAFDALRTFFSFPCAFIDKYKSPSPNVFDVCTKITIEMQDDGKHQPLRVRRLRCSSNSTDASLIILAVVRTRNNS